METTTGLEVWPGHFLVRWPGLELATHVIHAVPVWSKMNTNKAAEQEIPPAALLIRSPNAERI